jgi:REP element-mobilizing transposase RayT
MNRGYDGRPIFLDDEDKEAFIGLMEKAQGLTKVSVLAYCVMDNHYHLLLQNGSDRMAEFFKQLNGQYGSYYRQRHGGRGYVFQDRYKSLLIQDEAYLMLCFAYVMNNPVKAKRVYAAREYPWSCAGCYFSPESPAWLDVGTLEDLFGSETEMWRFVAAHADLEEPPLVKTPMGLIIGGEEFAPRALERADRRTREPSLKRKRVDDFYFEPVEKVIQELENKHHVKFDDLDFSSFRGKRLRAELLMYLKERAGLRYIDVAELDWFSGISINSLGTMYKRAKGKGG